MRFALAVGVACACLTLAPSAAAQPDADREAARAFEAGRRLFDSGDCPGAVAKFEESLRLRESVGAHASIAECREKDAPNEAWREFKRAERVARERHDDREAALRERADALVKGMTRFYLEIPRDLAGMKVVIDGQDMTEFATRGDACPVASEIDHLVEVSAPHKKTWTYRAHGKAGEIITVAAVLDDDAPSPPPVRPDAVTTTPTPRSQPPPPSEDGGSTQRVVGVTIGALGLAGLATGAVFGLVASSKASSTKTDCGATYPSCGQVANPQSVHDENSQANTLATVSTVFFLVGGAALAAGGVLFLTAPSAKVRGMTVTPLVGTSGAGLIVGRVF